MSKKFDLSDLINLLNFIILSLTTIWFIKTNNHPYIDINVFIASFLIHAQLYFFLKKEKNNSDPFLVILSLVILLFYLTRIFTLLFDEFTFSLVFTRSNAEYIGPDEFFNFLIYLHLCLWMIFFGLKLADKEFKIKSKKNLITKKQYKRLLFLSLLCLIYFTIGSFVFTTYLQAGILIGLLSGFLNYEVFIILITIMIFYYKDGIPKKYNRLAIFILFMFFFIKALNGGSGPILRIGFPFLFALLMIKRIKIKMSVLIVVAFLVVSTSIFGTFLKFSNQKINTELISDFKEIDLDQYYFIMSQIFARAAFLDFSIELINNEDYKRIINLSRYGKSIIDAYTPGFDVFDEPLTGHALRAVYLPSFPYKPTRKYVSENYHSDQINIFSEYYLLFGKYFSLLIFLISAFLFKKTYNYFTIIVKNKLSGLLAGGIILNFYWIWLRSFGIDFIISELFQSFIFPFMFIYIGTRIILKYRENIK